MEVCINFTFYVCASDHIVYTLVCIYVTRVVKYLACTYKIM